MALCQYRPDRRDAVAVPTAIDALNPSILDATETVPQSESLFQRL